MMLGKTASTDAETAANFRDDLTKIINEGSYMKKKTDFQFGQNGLLLDEDGI